VLRIRSTRKDVRKSTQCHIRLRRSIGGHRRPLPTTKLRNGVTFPGRPRRGKVVSRRLPRNHDASRSHIQGTQAATRLDRLMRCRVRLRRIPRRARFPVRLRPDNIMAATGCGRIGTCHWRNSRKLYRAILSFEACQSSSNSDWRTGCSTSTACLRRNSNAA